VIRQARRTKRRVVRVCIAILVAVAAYYAVKKHRRGPLQRRN